MILWDFIWAKMTKLFIPEFSVLASAGRPDRSTVLEVGRPTCTDVHASSGRRAGQPTRSTDSSVRPPTASFWSPIKGAFGGCFDQDFWRVFKPVFPTLLRGFLHKIESKYFLSKGEFYQECFAKWFLEFFTTHSILIFLTNTWATHWHIHPIGVFLWDCF